MNSLSGDVHRGREDMISEHEAHGVCSQEADSYRCPCSSLTFPFNSVQGLGL